MKTTIKVGLGGALIWIIMSLSAFLMGASKAFFEIGILINIFLLLCSIAVGIYLSRKEDGFKQTPFLKDFKEAMQAGVVYTLVIAAFIYFYHENIDPSIKQGLIDARLEALHKDVPDEATFLVKYGDDEVWGEKSFDDFIENQEDQTRSMISTRSVVIFHLMGLLLFSFFYAFFATIILRKIVLK